MISKIRLLLIAGLAMFSVATKAQVGATITITPTITQQSNDFKNLAGSDRKAEFMVLKSLFTTVATTTTCTGSSVAIVSNKAEVLNLFGTPTVTLSPNLISYNLSNGSSTCRAEIGIDNSDRVLFITINNCP